MASNNRIAKWMLGVTAGGLLVNLIKQLIEIDRGEKEKFDWLEFGTWGVVSMGIGLGAGAILDGIIVDPNDEEGAIFRETRHLRNLLVENDPQGYNEYDFQRRKAQEVSDAIQEAFDEHCLGPVLSGSHAKGTGIAGSSDIDVLVPYRKRSFRNTKEMYDATYDFLQDLKAGDPEIVKVRKQGKSIGVFCRKGHIETRLDIVPANERRNYRRDGDLTLHVRAKDWFSTATYTKTNIRKHKLVLEGSPSKKEVTRLLKVWKDVNNVDVSGFELELLVAQAYEYNWGQMPRTLFSKFVMCSQHIYDHVCVTPIRDPGSPSKRVLDDPSRQSNLRSKIGKMLADITVDKSQIAKWVPASID